MRVYEFLPDACCIRCGGLQVEFDQDGLVIGGRQALVVGDARHSRRQVLRHENEVAAMGLALTLVKQIEGCGMRRRAVRNLPRVEHRGRVRLERLGYPLFDRVFRPHVEIPR